LTLSKKITFSNFELQIQENGFYEISVNEKNDFKIDDLKKLVAAEAELGGEKLPVLVLCSEHASTDAELLKALSKNSNNPYSKADAFVIKSMAQKIMANFYLKINKPERPTKFFNNKQDALIWLKQYL
jgi:phenylalanyl-tRNA synthetase beta subunit